MVDASIFNDFTTPIPTSEQYVIRFVVCYSYALQLAAFISFRTQFQHQIKTDEHLNKDSSDAKFPTASKTVLQARQAPSKLKQPFFCQPVVVLLSNPQIGQFC